MEGIASAIAAALGGYAEGQMLAEDRDYLRQKRATETELQQMQLQRLREQQRAIQDFNNTDFTRPAIERTITTPDLTSMSEVPETTTRTIQVRPASVDMEAKYRAAAKAAYAGGDFKQGLELEQKAELEPYNQAQVDMKRAMQALETGNFAGAVPYLRAVHNRYPDGETISDIQFDPQTQRYFVSTLDDKTGKPLSSMSFTPAEAGDLMLRMTDRKAWLDVREHQRKLYSDAFDQRLGLAKLDQSQKELVHKVWADTAKISIDNQRLNNEMARTRIEAARVRDQINNLDVGVTDNGTQRIFYSKKTGKPLSAVDLGVSPDVMARLQADSKIKSKEDLAKQLQLETTVLGATRSLRFAELGLDPATMPTDPQLMARWRAAAEDASTHQHVVMLNQGVPGATMGTLAGPSYVYAAWRDPARRAEVPDLARKYGLRMNMGGSFFEDVPQKDGTILRRAFTADGQPIALDVIAPVQRRPAVQLTPTPFPLTDPTLMAPVAPATLPRPAIDTTSQIPR